MMWVTLYFCIGVDQCLAPQAVAFQSAVEPHSCDARIGQECLAVWDRDCQLAAIDISAQVGRWLETNDPKHRLRRDETMTCRRGEIGIDR